MASRHVCAEHTLQQAKRRQYTSLASQMQAVATGSQRGVLKFAV